MGIRTGTIGTHGRVDELVVVVHNTQENDGMVALVVEVVGAAVRWCCNPDMFPIDGSNGVLEVPPLREACCYVLSTIWCR